MTLYNLLSSQEISSACSKTNGRQLFLILASQSNTFYDDADSVIDIESYRHTFENKKPWYSGQNERE